MSTTEPQRANLRARTDGAPEGVGLGADNAVGWVTFAGMMIGLVGLMNLIYGIAAVGDSKFLIGNTKFVINSLHTLGWAMIAVAVVQGLASLGIIARVQFARWLGVAIAFVNAILQTIMLPAYPWWSLALFLVDMLVIYALIVHGGKEET
jgi:hypothetical protein